MFMLMTNQPFTRRKSLHHIIAHDGEVVWSGPNIGAAIEYLVAEEQGVFCLECHPSTSQYLVSLTPWTGDPHAPEIF